MIRESIVITTDLENRPHITPMGITFNKKKLIISPFIPSKTYSNLKENPYAVINFTDDVNIFVDALLSNKSFEIKPTKRIKGFFLKNTLSYLEIKVIKTYENKIRPKFECKVLKETALKSFKGFGYPGRQQIRKTQDAPPPGEILTFLIGFWARAKIPL